MKKLIPKSILSILVSCLMTNTIYAQTNNNNNSIERGFQVSFITPLGTNGIDSYLITNKVSINILGGYSYGNTILEVGGLYNVNTHLTKGLQFAGLLNYSGNVEMAVQVGGLANIATKGVTPFQASGLLNIVQEVKGLQIAGITNVAKIVTGLQIGGILNIAKKVRGVQFGLINYADSSDGGVSIGLINIVKNGGKQEFEVSFSDAVNTAVSFKLGTDKFYTIFSGGVNYLSSDAKYLIGIGLGTDIALKKGWRNQIEALQYQAFSIPQQDFNQLTQLKYTVSKEFFPHLKVFAGPVLNLTVAKHDNTAIGLDSSLSHLSLWSKDINSGTRLNLWLGFVFGVRF